MLGVSNNEIRTVDPIPLDHLTLHVLQPAEQCLGLGKRGKLSQYKLTSGPPKWIQNTDLLPNHGGFLLSKEIKTSRKSFQQNVWLICSLDLLLHSAFTYSRYQEISVTAFRRNLEKQTNKNNNRFLGVGIDSFVNTIYMYNREVLHDKYTAAV